MRHRKFLYGSVLLLSFAMSNTGCAAKDTAGTGAGTETGTSSGTAGTSSGTESVTETTTVAPLKMDTRAQEEMISTMAVRGLLHMAEARGSLHEKKYDAAADHLTQAQSLFRMAENNLPAARVQDQISIAKKHLEFQEAAVVEPDLIPLYVEIATFNDEGTRSRWRATVDKIKGHIKKGEKDAARKQLTLLERGVVVKKVSLPLQETSAAVSTAQKQLAAKEYDKADATLASAEKDLRVRITALIEPYAVTPTDKKAE